MGLGGRLSPSGRALALVGVVTLACAPGASAAPDDVVLEAETMTRSVHSDDRADANARNGRTLALWNNDPATKDVTAARSSVHLFVRLRGEQCVEAPIVSVGAGGKEWYRAPVPNTSYEEVGVRVSLPPGTHTVSVAMTNDYNLWLGNEKKCDRNLYVDKVTLVASPFSPTGWRNQPLPASTPESPYSDAMVKDIAKQMAASTARDEPQVWVSTDQWSVPVYTVPDVDPSKLVRVEHGPEDPKKDDANLEEQWTNVPLPPDAKAADPPWDPTLKSWGDANLLLWQPSTDTLWEFFHLRKDAFGNWVADYGGRMRNVSQRQGQFEDPPGLQYGSSATSISLLAGLMRIEELQRGEIDHAVGMTVTGARGYDGWCWPANRTDRQHFRNDRLDGPIPAGTRFRLPATFDLDRWIAGDPAANEPPRPMNEFGKMVARAAQRYGLIVTDSGQGVGFAAEDPTPTGADPYYEHPLVGDAKPRQNGPFRGEWPDQGGAMRNFPWSKLVALDQPADRPCTRDPDVNAETGDT